MTSSGRMSRTISCCVPPMTMPAPACSTSSASRRCSSASRVISSSSRSTASRRWRCRRCWKSAAKWLRAKRRRISCAKRRNRWSRRPCALDETRVEVNGEELVLESAGALWWPARETLRVRRSAFRKGLLLCAARPDVAALRHACDHPADRTGRGRRRPRRIIALGDSFHDPPPPTVSTKRSAQGWAACATAANGSGSPAITIPCRRPGSAGHVAEEVAIGGLIFRHEPQDMMRAAKSPAISIPARR